MEAENIYVISITIEKKYIKPQKTIENSITTEIQSKCSRNKEIVNKDYITGTERKVL